MKPWFKFAWRWHWIITLPVTAVFFFWCIQTAKSYVTFGIKFQVANEDEAHTVDLFQTGKREFQHLGRHVKLAFMDILKKRNIQQPGLRRFNLYVAEADLAGLNADLPHSGFNFVRGGILRDGQLERAKIRYRGDHIYHWGYFKKSWRVKTRKKKLFEGMRKINLISPRCDQLNNYLSYRLSALMGLITPRAEMIQLNLNGKNHGLYVMVEQLEELTLRQHNRMPGDLYSGDSIGNDKYLPRYCNYIFNFPRTWKKMAVNNHYPEDALKPLEQLLFLGKTADTDFKQEALMGLLDEDAWGRFAAFHILLQSEHYNNYHNWRLYYDPIRSKFEPVVWDPLGWYDKTTPDMGRGAEMDIIRCQLFEKLYQNADFLRAFHQAMESFFSSGLDQVFLKEADRIIPDVEKVIDRDPNLSAPARKVKRDLKRLRVRIENVFDTVRRGYLEDKGQVCYQVREGGGNIPLRVSGRLPLKRLVLHYEHPIGRIVTAGIRYWQNGRMIERDVSGAVSVSGTRLALQVPLIARFILFDPEDRLKRRVRRANVEPAYYELILQGTGADNRLIAIIVHRGQKKEQALPVDHIERIDFEDMRCIIPSRPVRQPDIWRGEVEVHKILNIARDLIIEPGTVVRMHPGASLILKGRLTARGSAQRPIQFVPADEEGEPWGTLTLLGRGADGSQLSYCRFSGGSGLKEDLFEYSAMFSVYDVSNVAVRFCEFYDSHIVDDMVRAVYADIDFSDCVFDRAHLDAVDLDISDSVIERCRFLNSGNDGLDLMTARSVVLDSEFRNNGDKGISVGENSKLLAINNRFLENQIGLQPKDSSVAVVFNVDFEGNGHAVDAFKKNWRYEAGGRAFLYKARIINNETTITACKESGIWIYDSYLDRAIEMKKKRIKVDMTVDYENRDSARDTRLWRYPEDITLTKDIENLFEPYLSSVTPEKRGAEIIAYH